MNTLKLFCPNSIFHFQAVPNSRLPLFNVSLLQTPGGRRFVAFLHQLARHVAERVADRLGQGQVGLTFDPVDAAEEEEELKSRAKAYRMAKQVRIFGFLRLIIFLHC